MQNQAAIREWATLILRVVVGVVFAVHGGQKLFLMGFDGVAGFFGMIGIPMSFLAAVFVTLLELVGGIALILGIGTRYVSALLVVNMLVAMFAFHMPNGFFVADNGYELVLTLAAAALYFALTGAGSFSLDARLTKSAA